MGEKIFAIVILVILFWGSHSIAEKLNLIPPKVDSPAKESYILGQYGFHNERLSMWRSDPMFPKVTIDMTQAEKSEWKSFGSTLTNSTVIARRRAKAQEAFERQLDLERKSDLAELAKHMPPMMPVKVVRHEYSPSSVSSIEAGRLMREMEEERKHSISPKNK